MMHTRHSPSDLLSLAHHPCRPVTCVFIAFAWSVSCVKSQLLIKICLFLSACPVAYNSHFWSPDHTHWVRSDDLLVNTGCSFILSLGLFIILFNQYAPIPFSEAFIYLPTLLPVGLFMVLIYNGKLRVVILHPLMIRLSIHRIHKQCNLSFAR